MYFGMLHIPLAQLRFLRIMSTVKKKRPQQKPRVLFPFGRAQKAHFCYLGQVSSEALVASDTTVGSSFSGKLLMSDNAIREESISHLCGGMGWEPRVALAGNLSLAPHCPGRERRMFLIMAFQALQDLTSACLSSPIWSLGPCSLSPSFQPPPHLCPGHFLCWKLSSLDVSCGQCLLILPVSTFMSTSSGQPSQVTLSSVGPLTYVLTQSSSVSFMASSQCHSVILL